MLDTDQRDQFDAILEEILADLPPDIHQLLEEVPLIVEDHPSDEILDELECEYYDELCGLHDGISLTERSVDNPPELPPQVHLFRLGILSLATDEHGRLDLQELHHQIRITLLHEIGHHFGLEEEDLRELGYE
jgi:predicted Zn-dependent protease with MMP-like domain